MKILQKILGLFGLTIIRQVKNSVYRDCKNAKFVKFIKK